MTADPRARWAAMLRAPADATSEDAAAAFLLALADDGFLPLAEYVAAANALTGTGVATGRDEVVKRLLRDEVDALAARYWSLAPAERRSTWADLSRRGADAVRLRELEPGLDVAVGPLADPAAEELSALVRKLFVLSPRDRAIRRNAWLLEHAAEVEKWRAAHAVLGRDALTLAALEPALGAALDHGFHDAFVEGASASTMTTLESVPARVVRFTSQRVREREQETEDEWYEAADRVRAKRIFQVTFLAFAALFVGSCAVSGIKEHRSRASAVYKPSAGGATSYSPPGPSDYPIYVPQPATRTFTAAEVMEFERYEWARAAGISGAAPRGYTDWVLAERPRGAVEANPPATSTHVYMTDKRIRACQAYDLSRYGPPPEHYDAWVQSGRPTTPGVLRSSGEQPQLPR